MNILQTNKETKKIIIVLYNVVVHPSTFVCSWIKKISKRIKVKMLPVVNYGEGSRN